MPVPPMMCSNEMYEFAAYLGFAFMFATLLAVLIYGTIRLTIAVLEWGMWS